MKQTGHGRTDKSGPDRNCRQCGTRLTGRADQKFCSVYCRNAYNNDRRQVEEKCIREINAILRSNWKVLRRLNIRKKTRIRMIELEIARFNFRYFTSVHETSEGKRYYFCYDQGYTHLQSGEVLLVEAFGRGIRPVG